MVGEDLFLRRVKGPDMRGLGPAGDVSEVAGR